MTVSPTGTCSLQVRLSLLTMTNLNQMREVLMFVCLEMADEHNLWEANKLSLLEEIAKTLPNVFSPLVMNYYVLENDNSYLKICLSILKGRQL